MSRPLFAACLIVSLAACQAPGADDDAPAEPTGTETAAIPAPAPAPSPASTVAEAGPAPTDTTADDSDCGADKLGRWLNVLPTEPIKADIAETVGERPIRYYTQGDPITMDFNPARLNAELGVDGRIKVFRCD